MESIEKTGETVEEAIAAGLAELGVTAAEVMVEVLEEPSRGLFGIGAKPARVRLLMMAARRPPEPPAPPPPAAKTPTPEAPSPQKPARPDREKPARPPRQQPAPRSSRNLSAEAEDDDEDMHAMAAPSGDEIPEEQADDHARVAKEVLLELLKRMEIEARVGILRAESTRDGEDMHWILNITGKNTARLIGRRGETLASLQYIVRLIVSRRLQGRANIIVDAGGYKASRSDRLKQLANRMADQALSQGRTVTLEPMPPHERRIVHLALRARQDVVTKSIGEGDSRKVTISPVKSS
jgi:spoIIIJ-associated protein